MMLLEDSHEWIIYSARSAYEQYKLKGTKLTYAPLPPVVRVATPVTTPLLKKHKKTAWAVRLQKRVNRWVKGLSDPELQDLLGYSREQLIDHLERQFDRKMSWSNYAGNRTFKANGTWVIDHIVPKSRFKESEAKAAFALTNLRPLCIKQNLSKNIQRTHLV